MSSSNPFRRVIVENRFNVAIGSGTLIEWEMEKWLVDAGPWVFVVQRSLRPDADWVDVATAKDLSWAYDVTSKQIGFEISNYYRVVVTTASATYTSEAVIAGNTSSLYEWRIAREMIRKHHLAFYKHRGGGNSKGWILRLPTFGEASANVDPNTGEVIDPNSSIDAGTGYVGGYWPPLAACIQMNPEKMLTRLTADRGVVNGVSTTATVLAFPRFRAKDVWVDAATDERFRVGGDIATVVAVGGFIIVQRIVLERLPAGHIVYTVPVPRG
jgi:hypothetical protein